MEESYRSFEQQIWDAYESDQLSLHRRCPFALGLSRDSPEMRFIYDHFNDRPAFYLAILRDEIEHRFMHDLDTGELYLVTYGETIDG